MSESTISGYRAVNCGKQKTGKAGCKQPRQYFRQNSVKNTFKLVLPFQQCGRLDDTKIERTHKNQTWASLWRHAALTHAVANNGEFIPLQS